MKASLTLAFALLLICTGTALASTPDGTPPSGETVCDGEVGAAYGLCTAYCEAMDCESDDPHASETACNKVGTKFLNITGRDVPCEVPAAACICASLPEWNAVLEGANSCFEGSVSVFLSTEPVWDFTEYAYSDKPQTSGSFSCGYTASGTTANLRLTTAEESLACVRLIRNVIASRGLTCEIPE
jgi:hypothetical protein